MKNVIPITILPTMIKGIDLALVDDDLTEHVIEVMRQRFGREAERDLIGDQFRFPEKDVQKRGNQGKAENRKKRRQEHEGDTQLQPAIYREGYI